jgi:hypothetical protein
MNERCVLAHQNHFFAFEDSNAKLKRHEHSGFAGAVSANGGNRLGNNFRRAEFPPSVAKRLRRTGHDALNEMLLGTRGACPSEIKSPSGLTSL